MASKVLEYAIFVFFVSLLNKQHQQWTNQYLNKLGCASIPLSPHYMDYTVNVSPLILITGSHTGNGTWIVGVDVTLHYWESSSVQDVRTFIYK